MRTHPAAIVTASARNVAASDRPIRPALAPGTVSQLTFILTCRSSKPFVHPVVISRWTTVPPSAGGSASRTSRNSRWHPARGCAMRASARRRQSGSASWMSRGLRLKGNRGWKMHAVETGLVLGRPAIRKKPLDFQGRLRLIVGGRSCSRTHPWVRGGPPQHGYRSGPSAQQYDAALRFARCDHPSAG